MAKPDSVLVRTDLGSNNHPPIPPHLSVGHRYLDTYLREGSGRYLPEWRELR
jgi:hypothetical protein